MKNIRAVGLALGICLALAMVVPAARAGQADQLTRLTFNAPIRIPGQKVLPAGTYWFQILNNGEGQRNVVTIYNADRTMPEATLMTRPAYRRRATDQTDIEVAGNSSKRPVALVDWFYPGRFYGQALIYSPATQKRIQEETRHIIEASTARG